MNLPGDQLLMARLLRPLIADDFYCYDTGGNRHPNGSRPYIGLAQRISNKILDTFH